MFHTNLHEQQNFFQAKDEGKNFLVKKNFGMVLVSDNDGNDKFLDFDDDKDYIPSEADISVFTRCKCGYWCSFSKTTEVDEIAEPVSIRSRKRKSNPSKWKKISDQILIEKIKIHRL